MPRFKLLIEYDGARYHGWQRQNGHPTVQAEIETALSTAVGRSVAIIGSGRTDAGVHARGQVAHFDVGVEIETNKLTRSLNGILPPDIAIREVVTVQADFHARYDAKSRRYRYYVSTQPTALDRLRRHQVPRATDFALMNHCAKALIGRHDYSSFCKTQSDTVNRFCSITRAEWVGEPRPSDHYFEIVGDRFLHGMVRAIVGTLLEISRGKRSRDSLPVVLAARNRITAGEAAAAKGLVLEEVTYGPSSNGRAPDDSTADTY